MVVWILNGVYDDFLLEKQFFCAFMKGYRASCVVFPGKLKTNQVIVRMGI